MKFTVSAGTLAAALERIALALDDRSNIEALRMVRIGASVGAATMTVDALDRRATVSVPVDVVEGGEVAIRCAALAGLAARLPADTTITIASDGNGVTVRAGRSRYTVAGLALDLIPQSAALTAPAAQFELDREDLARLLEVCAHAISREETRYYLNGVYLHPVDGMLRAVATDGNRLAFTQRPTPAGAAGMPGAIIPRVTIEILEKLLRKKPLIPTVAVAVSARLIELTLGELVLTSKLIDGTYPDYARVIPKPSGVRVSLPRAGLLAALARTEALIDPDIKGGLRIVSFSWGDGAFAVKLPNGNADDILDAEVIGTGLTAARLSYLNCALEALASQRVTIDSSNAGAPIRITDPDNNAALLIVMPTRS